MKQSELHYPVNFVIAVFQDLKESFKKSESNPTPQRFTLIRSLRP